MFPERLRKARNDAGLSQKTLAEKIFISQQAYAKYELGTSSPNPDTLSNIIRELGISADELLGTNISKKEAPTPEIRDERYLLIEALKSVVNDLSEEQIKFLLAQIRVMKEQGLK